MAQEHLLAEKGKSQASIYVPAEADRVTRFAAKELARYLRRMTGASFRVKEGGGVTGPALLVGDGEWVERLPAAKRPEAGSRDAFSVVSEGGQLYLLGNRSRCHLYAVYAFLEELGCRFIEPGVEVVPQRERLAVPALNRRERADFALRNLFRTAIVPQRDQEFPFLNADLHVPQIDWMAKRRLNHYEFYVDFYRYDLWEKHKHQVLDALLDRGLDLEVTHHSLHYFCPPDENHDFGDYGPATYQRNHPDWYQPGYECGPRGRWQTRVEIPAVQEIVLERYLEFVRQNPELKIVGVWPDDIPMNAPYRGLSRTDGYMRFWNRVGKGLRREFRDKLLGIIAYFELIEPPRRVKPGENLHCWFCPISRQYMFPVTHRRNREFRDHLRGWVGVMPPDRVAIFEYYGWQLPMIPHRANMAEDFPVYADMGVGGIYGWAGFTLNLLGDFYQWAIDYYALTELLWNARADLEAAEQTWAQHVYGPAAERVLDFYTLIKKAHGEESRKGRHPSFQWVSLDVMHRGQELLAAARQQADSPEAVRRLNLLEQAMAWGCTAEVWRKAPPRKYTGM